MHRLVDFKLLLTLQAERVGGKRENLFKITIEHHRFSLYSFAITTPWINLSALCGHILCIEPQVSDYVLSSVALLKCQLLIGLRPATLWKIRCPTSLIS